MTNRHMVIAPLPIGKQLYVIDFITSGSSTISSVKVGSGVSFKGRGTPVTGGIAVYGKRKLRDFYQRPVMTLYGSKRLTMVNTSGKTTSPSTSSTKVSQEAHGGH